MQLLEEGTVSAARGQAGRSGFKAQLDNDHGEDRTSGARPASVSVDTADLRRRFGAVPLLRKLPPDVVEALWVSCRPRRTPAGGTIIEQASRADHLVLLLIGRAASTAVTAHGRSVQTDAWTAPSVLDKVVTFAGGEHPARIVAGETTWWCALPRDRLEELLDRHPAARRHVLRLVARAARDARASFVSVSTSTSLSRLAAWLLATAEDGEAAVPRPQELLARQLGMTRVTLNRGLHHLAGADVIGLHRQRVMIRDRARLQELADGC